MQNFFQSEEYLSLFKNCAVCIPHKIKFTFRGESYYIIAVQYLQNLPNLPKNPIIIDGLCLPEGSISKQVEVLRQITSRLKSHHFLPFSILQIRNSIQLNDFSLYMNDVGFTFQNHINYKLNTTTTDICWNQLCPNRKKQILKSFKNGATICEAKKENDVVELYKILQELYREKIHKQIPPISIFIKFLNLSFLSEKSKIFLIKYQGEIVGGSICPIDPSKQIYEWYVCGLDKKFKTIHPSVLATWAPIIYASKNNIPSFDFMGAGKPDVPYGVRNFKRKFGGQLINVGKFVYCK